MNRLEIRLRDLNPNLFSALQETKNEVKLLLNQYNKNFPEYTDHSIHHTEEVFNIVDEILNDDEIVNLNSDEIYVLSMSSYLHDIGMCIPENKIKHIADTEDLLKERELHPEIKRENYLRDIHHTLSRKFILEEWELLKIPTKKYAEAIALVSEGHRVVDIGNPDIYTPKFFVKNGREFVCLPYLAAILRIADELDITNIRTPKLLTKYYMPENEKSVIEWKKHIANTQRNFAENFVEFDIECSNHQMLASLEDQFNKIKDVLNFCQKVIRNISNTEGRIFNLNLNQVKEKFKYIDFDPKGIKYTFDVEKVVDAFVGENLYNDKFTTLREVLQNSIDTCRYKRVLEGKNYVPKVDVIFENDKIIIKDNGLGMDEFIIKNFFGKLGSSFYQQENVKKDYEAIGNFGVGVFSYFLMSDYIDIETKTKKSDTLHFRLDKDPKNYFHFFQQYERKTPGTTITLHLKRDLIDIEKTKFVNYIQDKFRFVEFPINITLDKESISIVRQSLLYDNLKEDIYSDLSFTSKKIINDLRFYIYQFDNEDYEGSITIVYDEKYRFLGIPGSFLIGNSKIRKQNYSDTLKMEISQKGVLVTDYYSSNYGLLSDNFLLKLNLKNKINIDINRNSFSDNSIDEIINNLFIKAYIGFLNKKSLHNNLNKKLILSSLIFENLRIRQFFDYHIKLEELLFFKTFKDGKLKIIDLKGLKDINETIFLSHNSDYTEHILKVNEKSFILEITYGNEFLSKTIDMLKHFNFNIKLIRENNKDYLTFDKKNENVSKKYLYNVIDTDTDISTINIDFGRVLDQRYKYYYGTFYNKNHYFIKQIIANYDLILTKNQNLFREIISILDSMSDYNFDKRIEDLNFLIETELSKIILINYKFERKDFDI